MSQLVTRTRRFQEPQLIHHSLSLLACYKFFLSSQKSQRLARAYLNFNKPEDIIEFSECFDGHVFVNEKGNFVNFNIILAFVNCSSSEPTRKVEILVVL